MQGCFQRLLNVLSYCCTITFLSSFFFSVIIFLLRAALWPAADVLLPPNPSYLKRHSVYSALLMTLLLEPLVPVGFINLLGGGGSPQPLWRQVQRTRWMFQGLPVLPPVPCERYPSMSWQITALDPAPGNPFFALHPQQAHSANGHALNPYLSVINLLPLHPCQWAVLVSWAHLKRTWIHRDSLSPHHVLHHPVSYVLRRSRTRALVSKNLQLTYLWRPRAITREEAAVRKPKATVKTKTWRVNIHCVWAALKLLTFHSL